MLRGRPTDRPPARRGHQNVYRPSRTSRLCQWLLLLLWLLIIITTNMVIALWWVVDMLVVYRIFYKCTIDMYVPTVYTHIYVCVYVCVYIYTCIRMCIYRHLYMMIKYNVSYNKLNAQATTPTRCSCFIMADDDVILLMTPSRWPSYLFYSLIVVTSHHAFLLNYRDTLTSAQKTSPVYDLERCIFLVELEPVTPDL